MTTNDLTQLRGTIETELTTIDRSISEMRSELRSSSETNVNAFQDLLDCAKDETDLSTMVEIHNHASAKSHKLRAALIRLENGCFGLCIACQYEIDRRRLRAHPEALLCISCQEFKDIGTSRSLHKAAA